MWRDQNFLRTSNCLFPVVDFWTQMFTLDFWSCGCCHDWVGCISRLKVRKNRMPYSWFVMICCSFLGIRMSLCIFFLFNSLAPNDNLPSSPVPSPNKSWMCKVVFSFYTLDVLILANCCLKKTWSFLWNKMIVECDFSNKLFL